jgi:hypothetical protein
MRRIMCVLSVGLFLVAAGCASTRAAALFRCTFEAPQPASGPVTSFAWLAHTDGYEYRYFGFEYD